jgi:E3 ubiquitin-protein ligase mind-bomb
MDKIGTVHRVTDKGDIRVQYEGNDNRWTIARNALMKIKSHSVGDYVRISNDEDLVRSLQKGHGEWTDNMKYILNKLCRVTTVYSDGDLRICHNNTMSFTLNPLCCSCVSKNQADIQNTIAFHNMEDATVQSIISKNKDLDNNNDDNEETSASEGPERLVREAAHGRLHTVKDLLTKSLSVSS